MRFKPESLIKPGPRPENRVDDHLELNKLLMFKQLIDIKILSRS